MMVDVNKEELVGTERRLARAASDVEAAREKLRSWGAPSREVGDDPPVPPVEPPLPDDGDPTPPPGRAPRPDVDQGYPTWATTPRERLLNAAKIECRPDGCYDAKTGAAIPNQPGLLPHELAIKLSARRPIRLVGDFGRWDTSRDKWDQPGEAADEILFVAEKTRSGPAGTIGGLHFKASIDGSVVLVGVGIRNEPSGSISPIHLYTHGTRRCHILGLSDVELIRAPGHDWDAGGVDFPWKFTVHAAGFAAGGIQVFDTDMTLAREHGGVYAENAPGRNIVHGCRLGAAFRSGGQWVNRTWPNNMNNPGGPLPPGFGDLEMSECHVSDVAGEGGGGLSIQGQWGNVLVRDCQFDGVTRDDFAGKKEHAAIVCSTSANHGTHVDSDGFAVQSLTVLRTGFDLPNADRDHIKVSAVRRLVIELPEGLLFSGNKTAIALEDSFGGGRPNGEVIVTRQDGGQVSAWPGWNTARKMSKHDAGLSDAQIDSLGVRLER